MILSATVSRTSPSFDVSLRLRAIYPSTPSSAKISAIVTINPISNALCLPNRTITAKVNNRRQRVMVFAIMCRSYKPLLRFCCEIFRIRLNIRRIVNLPHLGSCLCKVLSWIDRNKRVAQLALQKNFRRLTLC